MTHFVRVENGEVKDVWDTPPQEGVGNNGWRNAVEVRPSIQAGRQGYTAHRFDLNVDRAGDTIAHQPLQRLQAIFAGAQQNGRKPLFPAKQPQPRPDRVAINLGKRIAPPSAAIAARLEIGRAHV